MKTTPTSFETGSFLSLFLPECSPVFKKKKIQKPQRPKQRSTRGGKKAITYKTNMLLGGGRSGFSVYRGFFSFLPPAQCGRGNLHFIWQDGSGIEEEHALPVTKPPGGACSRSGTQQIDTFHSMQTLLSDPHGPSLPLPHGQRCGPCHALHFPHRFFSFCSEFALFLFFFFHFLHFSFF